ncbi:MAG: hypothetical protein MJA83_19815 [Gammaproteobacteria bacterium]|nr:hypothetical protein [Gammaproteobacteria bacterium]
MKNGNRILGLALCLVCVFAHGGAYAANASGWVAVYKHDREGKPLWGDKEVLFDAVRRGYPIRFGWGVKHPREPERSVEHVGEPEFLTIVDGKELFVQLPEHIAQESYWSVEEQNFGDPAVVWKGIMGTTGRFHAVWYNRASGEVVRRLPQRVPITWYVEYPNEKRRGEAEKLFDVGKQQ